MCTCTCMHETPNNDFNKMKVMLKVKGHKRERGNDSICVLYVINEATV